MSKCPSPIDIERHQESRKLPGTLCGFLPRNGRVCTRQVQEQTKLQYDSCHWAVCTNWCNWLLQCWLSRLLRERRCQKRPQKTLEGYSKKPWSCQEVSVPCSFSGLRLLLVGAGFRCLLSLPVPVRFIRAFASRWGAFVTRSNYQLELVTMVTVSSTRSYLGELLPPGDPFGSYYLSIRSSELLIVSFLRQDLQGSKVLMKHSIQQASNPPTKWVKFQARLWITEPASLSSIMCVLEKCTVSWVTFAVWKSYVAVVDKSGFYMDLAGKDKHKHFPDASGSSRPSPWGHEN